MVEPTRAHGESGQQRAICRSFEGQLQGRRRVIREALAEAANEPTPPPAADDEHLIQSKELRRILSGVSDMFLWRHSRRPTQASSVAAKAAP